MYAGIWDDRHSWLPSDFGGHCIQGQAVAEFSENKEIEVVKVQLAYDDALSGFPGQVASGVDLKNLTISCLRPARNYRLAMMKAFHEECMEDVDEALYAEYMKVVGSYLCLYPYIVQFVSDASLCMPPPGSSTLYALCHEHISCGAFCKLSTDSSMRQALLD